MTSNRLEQFDIRNFTDRLTPAKGSNRYICPVCGGNNLTIDPNSTKYKCWSGCECRDIREAITPWDEGSRKTYRSRRVSGKPRKKSRFSAPAPIPEKIELARLPEIPTDRPSRRKPPWIPKEAIEKAAKASNVDTIREIRYWYSKTQWVSRFQWSDSKMPKGYDKTFRQGHIDEDGKSKWNKGHDHWLPYRFDEVLAHAKGKWVILSEGEESVEATREFLQLVAITLQGSSWSADKIERAIKELKSAEIAGVVFPYDNDQVGVKKANKVFAAAAKLQFPCILIEPTKIWSALPQKGDLADWLKWGQNQGMKQSEFIEQLERTIHEAVDNRQRQKDEWSESNDYEAENYSGNGTSKKPDPESVAEMIADEYREKWAFHNEQKIWRLWNEKCWESIELEAFTQVVYKTIKSRGVKCERFSFVENVMKFLKAQLLVRKWISFDRKLYINFDNGVLDIKTGELNDHHPGFRFTSCLPRSYQKLDLTNNHLEALREYCPHFFKWAMIAMNGDSKKILKLLAITNGVIKFRFHDLQMFVHLVGKPGTGKGTFSRLLTKIVGKENSESTRLKKLDKDYEIDKIIDAQLVICPDEDKQVGEFGGLKSLTGGDDVSYRPIYRPPASSPFYGALAVISNNPIFAGDTTGLDRRLCIAQFDNPIPATKRDSRTEDLLASEIEPLTTVALSLSDPLVTQVLRGIGESEIPDFKVAAWEMKMQTDSLVAWLNANLIYDLSAFTPVGTKKQNPNCSLYANYCDFCQETGVKAKSLSNFSPNLLALCHEIGWIGVNKTRSKYGYRINGVRLREPNDDDVPFYEDTLKPPNEFGVRNSEFGVRNTTPNYELRTTNSSVPQSQNSPNSNSNPNSELLTTNSELIDVGGVDQIQGGVGQGVGLEPLPDQESVGGVGLEVGRASNFDPSHFGFGILDFGLRSFISLASTIEVIQNSNNPELDDEPKLNDHPKSKIENLKSNQVDGINTQPEKEETISVEKCQSEPNPTPSTPSAQGKAFSPTPGVSESLHQPTPSTPTSIDYSTYPHLTSNDDRAKRNRAEACKQQMLACTDSDELETFHAEGGFSETERAWVHDNLMTRAECDKLLTIASSEQLNLFSQEPTQTESDQEKSNSDSDQGELQPGDVVIDFGENGHGSTATVLCPDDYPDYLALKPDFPCYLVQLADGQIKWCGERWARKT